MTGHQENTTRKKRIIAVLGMHRSGTSAITRGLQALGADLGPELMPGAEGDNDKGFFEDLGCNRINERILEKLGSSWDSVVEVPEAAFNGGNLEDEYNDALALLRERLAGTEVFAFKDPRTVNLLPFWQRAFNELSLDDRYLLIVRNPRSVADSLAKRNKFDREKSFCLWMKHTCNALRYVVGKPVVLLDYDRFMEAPARDLQRIAEPFGLPPLDKEMPAVHEYLESFLSQGMRHSQYAEVNTQEDVVPPFVAELYEDLLTEIKRQLQGACEDIDVSRRKSFCEKFSQYSAVMAYVDRLEKKQATNEKQAQLYGELEEHLKGLYSKVLVFDRSLLGRVFALVETVYLLFGLRRRHKTLYGEMIKESQCYLSDKGVPPECDAPQGRLHLMANITRYVVRHPLASLRLISVSRLKKLFKAMFSADSSLAREWGRARFATENKASRIPDIFPPESFSEDTELTFPVVSDPLVSIIIPVYNQYRTTLSCLKAVLEKTTDVPYEVVVADDCSTDMTDSIEDRVHKIRVIRGEKNLGFLENCNNAVAHANGKYVVLLNNDTNPQKGWLKALVDIMEGDPRAGLVGPKLLFENGVLQEAGGIVWKDASGWNYGRGQSPDLPEFNYVRETDYISGACILFDKRIWDELGGFDTRFCPAYYEDTDLAFQIRARGLKVMYQPNSEVVHFEGISNGTDVGSGIKKHQAINQKVFREKWQEILELEHFDNGHNVFQARERTVGKRTVVFVDHYVPFYDQDAGSRSTFLYIKSMLDAELNVKFVPANFFPHQPYTRALQQLGVEVLLGEKYMLGWKSWFSDNSQYIDVIYLHRPHVTEAFIDHLVSLEPRPKLIYFGHDLHYLRTRRESDLLGKAPAVCEADDWKKRELAIFDKVDKVYYPSCIEVEEVRRVAPETDVSAIPLYLLHNPDITNYKHEERDGLLFVGGFNHSPNKDAVQWFVEDVFPAIKQEIPEICFHIVGLFVPEKIKKLASSNVKIHGFLSDAELSSLYQQVKVCVVPLRYGAGVKGKVLEALQAGLPIVTTPIGAEGLPDAEKVMAIAKHAEEMSDQILSLYKNPSKCISYLNNYPGYIEQNFSERQVQNIIEQDFLN